MGAGVPVPLGGKFSGGPPVVVWRAGGGGVSHLVHIDAHVHGAGQLLQPHQRPRHGRGLPHPPQHHR